MSKTCTPEPVFVYVAYSRKLPNLPIAIGDSIGELAQQCGMSIKDTSDRIDHKSKYFKKVRIYNI